MVQGHGVNDMPYGWVSESEWNEKVYRKWTHMLYRCYNEDFHKTKNGKNYIGCTVCERWLTLSNFVADFEFIDGYDEERFLNGELILDKDIKSGGANKRYVIEECLLTTQGENAKEANRTRDNSYLQGENHPMYGKLGLKCPNSKQVAQYNKETLKLIKVWGSMREVERELGINQSSVSKCCKGKRKSAGGFIWRYVEGAEE